MGEYGDAPPEPDGSVPGEGTTRDGSSSEALYGISLDLLAELLRQWCELWSTTRAEMEALPAETREELRRLPSDPQVGLQSAVGWFARSFHPEVVEFFIANLDASAALVEHLADEERAGTIRFSGDGDGLEDRVRRLEYLIGGVGAVLRTLSEAPDQDRRDGPTVNSR